MVSRVLASPLYWRALLEKTFCPVDLVISAFVYIALSPYAVAFSSNCSVLTYACPIISNLINCIKTQVLLLDVHLCCNFIGLMKVENMQSLDIFLGRNLLILVSFMQDSLVSFNQFI